MRIIPYLRRQYETGVSKETMIGRLERMIHHPDWNITIGKAFNHRVLEGELTGDSFMLVMGRHALSYGRRSLLPVMKGNIGYDHKRSTTIVKIVIHPFSGGTLLLLPVYCLLIYLLELH